MVRPINLKYIQKSKVILNSLKKQFIYAKFNIFVKLSNISI